MANVGMGRAAAGTAIAAAIVLLAAGCVGKIPNPSIAPTATLTLKDDLTYTPLAGETVEAINAYLSDAHTMDGTDAWHATANRRLVRVQTPVENYVIGLLLNRSDWLIGIDMFPLSAYVHKVYVNDDIAKGERLLELTRREMAAPAGAAPDTSGATGMPTVESTQADTPAAPTVESTQ
jgi:hypothetical protein